MRKTLKTALITSLSLLILVPFLLFSIQAEEGSSILEKNKSSVFVVTATNEEGAESARGSGFLVGAGVMVTNYHLVANTGNLTVTNYKGRKVKVEGLVGIDKNHDLALLQVKSKDAPLTLGDSANLGIGNVIFAVGGNEAGEIAVADGKVANILEYDPNQRILEVSLPSPKQFSGAPIFSQNGEALGMLTVFEGQTRFIIPANFLQGMKAQAVPESFKGRQGEEYFDTLEGAYFAAKVYAALKNNTRAERYINQVVKIKPDEANAFILLAKINTEQRKYSAAISAYEKLIGIRPDMDTAHLGLGIVNVQMMKWKEAIAPLEKSLQLNSDNKEAYLYLGKAHKELRQFSESEAAYEKYLETNPANAWEIYKELGEAQLELEQYDKAIVSFEKAVKINAQDIKINTELANAYKGAKQYQKAEETLMNLSKLSPEDTKIYVNNIIRMYDEAGMGEKAIAASRKLIELEPDNADAYYNLGYMFVKQENFKDAVTEFQKAIELRPNFEYAYTNLGYCYTKLKKYKESIEVYKKLVSLNPQNGEAWLSIGIGYMFLRNFLAALEPMQKAVEISPQSTSALFNLGVVYVNISEFNKAIQIQKRLQELDPDLAKRLLKLINS